MFLINIENYEKSSSKINQTAKHTCRKGSLIPLTSCSGVYPAMTKFFNVLTNVGTHYNHISIFCTISRIFIKILVYYKVY